MAEHRERAERSGCSSPSGPALKALISTALPGDDWDDLFGRLTPAEIEGLRSLVPYMPRRAVQHFADRLSAAN